MQFYDDEIISLYLMLRAIQFTVEHGPLSIHTPHIYTNNMKPFSSPNYHHIYHCYKFSYILGKYVDCAQICCANKAFFIILNLL